MKKLVITRKTATGEASYKARGLDTIFDREQALQQDCIEAIQVSIKGLGKSDAEKLAKLILKASASVHSELEHILRNHGKKQEEEV